jgi:hypothetical protein
MRLGTLLKTLCNIGSYSQNGVPRVTSSASLRNGANGWTKREAGCILKRILESKMEIPGHTPSRPREQI